MKCEKGHNLKVIEFIKSDGTTNRPYDRVIAQCPKCKTVINTIYNPQDWYTERQLRVIERLMKETEQ